jgi:outer membrane protein OmpA-like peptidoglycan-associated protein
MKILQSINVVATMSALTLVACAGSNPPDQLVKAREAYTEAQHSDASQYDPAAVHEAKTALDRAETLYKDDADEARVNDAAYIAMRRAERAKVEGHTASLNTRKEQLEHNAQQAQAKAAQDTQARLVATRDQLEEVRAARKAAEARADDAMTKLRLNEAAAMAEKPSGTVITVAGAFLFSSGKSELQPGAGQKLDKIADALSQQGDRKIIVRGYTDSTGAAEANVALSKARADSVASYLAAHGVPRDKITTDGLGESDPVAPNDTATGRASNRRVEIEVQRIEPR